MKRGLMIGLAFGVLAAGMSALAESGADLLPSLTEDIVTRIMPVMRAEGAQVEVALAEMEEGKARLDEHMQLVEDIGAGKVDPLAWLKAGSKYLITPPSAKYEQNLSRWVSSSYLFEPVALFSFGIDAPQPVTDATRDGEKAASFILSGQDLSGQPGGKEFEGVIDGIMKFYHDNKFKDAGVQHFFMYSTMSPDSSIDVFLHYINMFTGMPASEGVPNGPLLWLSLSSANVPAEAISKSESGSAEAPLTVEAALASAGMTYEAYKEYLSALVMAKTDAANPSALDMTFDVPGLSADQADGMKVMQDFYAVRKSNLKVYHTMEAQVRPVLEKMGL